MKFNRQNARKEGFSVTELVLAMGVVTLLFALTVPSIRYFRENAKGVQCLNNLRQIGAATLQYATEHRGEIPYYSYNPTPESTGSGAAMGAWYWLLAPYAGVARTEVPASVPISENRVLLGTSAARIDLPCLFTCPGHRRTESNSFWAPEPMTFPTALPVSYAPPLMIAPSAAMKAQKGGIQHASGYTVYPLRLHEVTAPSRKIWLMDSPHPRVLNVSAARWQPSEAYRENWPRQGMTRHREGGNALFYDGHVEWFPIKTFTHPPEGRSVERNLSLYLNPYRDPSLDE